MAEDTVKLTVRLPAQLHRALKERAVAYQCVAEPSYGRYAGRELLVAPSCRRNRTRKSESSSARGGIAG